jgi:Na+/H+ antiporter NhaC
MMHIDINHLKKANTTYWKHFKYAMYYNFLAFLVFLTGMIHAVFPFMFPFTPYKLAKRITNGTEQHFKHHN